MQFGDHGGQRDARIGGSPDQAAELNALRFPLPGGEQVGGRVGVTARARHEHIPAAQPVTQSEQHTQLPVVPIRGRAAGFAGLVEVAAPLHRHEPGRGVIEDLAPPGRVQLAQHVHRDQQLGRGGTAAEAHRFEHRGGELTQVVVGGIQRRQMPVITRQPGLGLGDRRAQALPPDLLAADQRTDLLIRNAGVGDDFQQIVQQRLTVLSSLPSFGQPLLHLPFGSTEFHRDRLIEQRHDLIEDIGAGLGQHREQDRIPALRIPTLQRLRTQAPAHRGQKPAPLGGQHRHIQPISAQPAQETQLVDLGADRGRRGLHRPGRQPPQPRDPQRSVGDKQAVQLRAPRRSELVSEPVIGFGLGLVAGVGDPLDHGDRAWPDHLRRDQILTRQPEQQSRGIVLHRPREQELIELLELERTDRTPSQVPRGQAHMLGAGLGSPAVGTDHHRIQPQLLGDTSHRHRRSRDQPIRHESQPRQRTQRDRQAQPLGWAPAPARIHERQIRRRQREVPEQLLAADLRESPQSFQLLVREHPRRHDPSLHQHRPTSSSAVKHQPVDSACRTRNPVPTSRIRQIRPISGGCYGYPSRSDTSGREGGLHGAPRRIGSRRGSHHGAVGDRRHGERMADMAFPPEDDHGQPGLVRLDDGHYGYRWKDSDEVIVLYTPGVDPPQPDSSVIVTEAG
ncbi:hypothetical protein RAJCM14343_1470 [Rhodococcus aetherivorans]|uniref:Uncharacterized protein n=3 Tax=Rhodococcus TaxID=1827 RepID=A0ABQ0YI77_9NOCA|nr:hypothetical protein RAJCM14343_1470 [Rhodococcus aetherivorans]